jgi:hypothetical protein
MRAYHNFGAICPVISNFWERTFCVMNPRILLVSILLAGWYGSAAGQSSGPIQGTVLDSLTRQPIAFAHIRWHDEPSGTWTGIDGRFTLPRLEGASLIWVSHTGYHPAQIQPAASPLVITLSPRIQVLQEVAIRAGENPADVLVRKAVEHKLRHHPEQLQSFSYTTYNKLITSLESTHPRHDSLIYALKTQSEPLSRKDSAHLSMEDFRLRQHVYVSESVTKKYFQKPAHRYEELVAHQNSGFKSPLFSTLPDDFQPLGMYDDILSLLGNEYVNPLSKNSEKKYFFELTDTLFYEADTVFVIRFEPKSTGPQWLTGTMALCVPDFALKHIVVKPTDPHLKIDFHIRQNYERWEGGWFPTQLQTDLLLKEYSLGFQYVPKLSAQSFFSDIRINPGLDKKLFRSVSLELDHTQPGQLAHFRPYALDSLESNTHEWYDSLRQKIRFIRLADKLADGLFARVLPLGKFDLRLNQITGFNEYERFRLGMGLQTNPRLSSHFIAGAYAAYGFGDMAWKYGGFVEAPIWKRKDLKVRASFTRDLQEVGLSRYFLDDQLLATDVFRDFLSFRFDRVEETMVQLQIRPRLHWATRLGFSQSQSTPRFDYQWQEQAPATPSYRLTELSWALRYMRGERRMGLGGRQALIAYGMPYFSLQITQAWESILGGDFSFYKVDFIASNEWKHRRWGKTHLTAIGNLTHGHAPLLRMHHARGGASTAYWLGEAFQTMGIYEFLHSEQVSLFAQRNFGPVGLNKRWTRPELILAGAGGMGQFSQEQLFGGIEFLTMEKGYWEAGGGFDNLVRINYANLAHLGLGVGAFYRMGHYRHPNHSDNLAVKFRLSFTF